MRTLPRSRPSSKPSSEFPILDQNTVSNINALLEFSEELLETLEKTAAALDLQEARSASLSLQLSKAAAAAPAPAFDQALLTKFAQQLEREELLLEGMSVDDAIRAMNCNPNLLTKLAFSLVTPVTEGMPIVSPNPSPDEKQANIVEFRGRKLVDNEGWLAAIS